MKRSTQLILLTIIYLSTLIHFSLMSTAYLMAWYSFWAHIGRIGYILWGQ